MENSARRMLTIEKIDRSINECNTLDQLVSTEQFLTLYYRQFDFDSQYVRKEWTLDCHIRARKSFLETMPDSEPGRIHLGKEKASLKRLNEYVKKLSTQEFEAIWDALQPQLATMTVDDISLYSALCEKIAYLKSHRSQPESHLQVA